MHVSWLCRPGCPQEDHQVSVTDKNGEELLNKKIANTPKDIRYNIGCLHKDSKLVMESSSVGRHRSFR